MELWDSAFTTMPIDMSQNGQAAFLFNGHWYMDSFLDEETGTKLEDSYKWTVIPLPASGDGKQQSRWHCQI